MKTFDPGKPVSLDNWPQGLRMPPFKKAREPVKPTALEKPSPKPSTDADVSAPWWSD